MMSLPNGTYAPATMSFIDAGMESASLSVYGKVLTAANFDAQVGLFGDLKDAVAAIVLGQIWKQQYGNSTQVAKVRPTNGAAREIGLRVKWSDDTTGETYTDIIPTIDPTIPAYDDNADSRDAVLVSTPSTITDLITAWEAFVVNPLHPANAISVIGLSVVRGGK